MIFFRLNLSVKVLVSYNVTSLFTNIPLQETTEIAINLICNHSSNLNVTKKSLKDFCFLLRRGLYKQINGVAIGFRLVAALANIFVGFYWRYVDLAAFGKEQDSLNSLNNLNKKQPNIKLIKQ